MLSVSCFFREPKITCACNGSPPIYGAQNRLQENPSNSSGRRRILQARLTCWPWAFSSAKRMVLPGSSGPEGCHRPDQTARKPPKPKMNTITVTCAAPQIAPMRSFASDADAQQRCQIASLHTERPLMSNASLSLASIVSPCSEVDSSVSL